MKWFSRLGRAVFIGVYGEIFAVFEAFVVYFHTIRPWTVVGTLYLDGSYVTFKYFAFLSVCDKFELLGDVHATMMIRICFCCPSWIYCWLLLAVLSDYFGHLVTSTFLLCKFRVVPASTPVSFPVMKRWKCLAIKRSSQPSSITTGKRAEKICQEEANMKRITPNPERIRSIFNQKRWISLNIVITFENQTFFIIQCENWERDFKVICMQCALCAWKSLCKILVRE